MNSNREERKITRQDARYKKARTNVQSTKYKIQNIEDKLMARGHAGGGFPPVGGQASPVGGQASPVGGQASPVGGQAAIPAELREIRIKDNG